MPEPETFEIDREPVHVSYSEKTVLREVYGFSGGIGRVMLDGYRWRPRGRPSKTLLMYMHPAATMHNLPVPAAMVRAGAHVLLAGSRYNRNDAPLIMENAVRDFGAYVRHAKEVWGYEKVVMVGWSGGGSLTTFYQSMAVNPTVTETPAGDPVDLSGFVPGDGFVCQAAHLSRATVLKTMIDPSVLDENDPSIRDPELDIYDPRNPNQPPYSADYIAHFRAAQIRRIRRRTAYVKELLHSLRKKGASEAERAIVTHRTLADPRFIDPTIEPNDRVPGQSYLGPPELSNSSPAGLARFSTLRAWLSQWSFDDTNADAIAHAPNIRVPLLVLENSGDDAVPQPHPREFFDAATGATDKTFHVIRGANHYYQDQPEHCAEAVRTVIDWMRARQLFD
ncbi:alpha/beta hydrolase family protein [Oceanibacterium hippocampi]|uniref:Alpha/beta hydrolase family protein n=1 Tax=Oceanibacterium hippocampi TaxID=745714 RepID=A0A1Y5S2I9_9PROT|nr:alpha/beta fold hydrolase [Oceanibacterium hippocampi]SLN30830.1 Alpha/beta hydrolase family protein [Oceanibacterium hippocampi]